MNKKQTHWLIESLKTIKNHSEIAIMLIQLKREELLPTILEEIFEDSQELLEKHSIKSLNPPL